MRSRRRRIQFLWLEVFAVVTLVIIFYFLGLRVNLTNSMPIGIYQRYHNLTIRRGDIASFCLPKPIASIGKLRGYIGGGFCPDNTILLLKQVIALPGDCVELSSNFIRVNNVYYFAPQQKTDHQEHYLTRWVKNGIYLHSKTVWLYGSHDPVHSWDSRYFGGVLLTAIRGIYRPLWIF